MKLMVDVVTPNVRSRMMSGIRGKDTAPEMLVRQYLHRRGMRYRLHDKKLPGTPDLVFASHGTVVFIHGCYWHRHKDCKYASTPVSNVEFWQRKFAGNVRRDGEAVGTLMDKGWNVIVLWECGIRKAGLEENLAWLPQAICQGKSGFVEWPIPYAESGFPDETTG